MIKKICKPVVVINDKNRNRMLETPEGADATVSVFMHLVPFSHTHTHVEICKNDFMH